MAIFRRFRVQQKYVNGQPTEEYRLGVEVDGTNYHSLEACESGSECTELEYRWVDMELASDYYCEGANKYKKQKKQQKCVNEETWTDVYPYEYRAGDIIEYDSEDCGYVSDEYHIYGATDGYGSINISPSKAYYSSTDVVTITALPSTDYMFSCYNYGRNLNYGSVAYSSVLSLTMSNNWYVSAVFKSAQYKVYNLTTVGGSLTISPSKEYYNPTDIVTITAIPNTNYSFSNYSYGSTSEYGQNTTNSTLTLTMSNDWYVRGNFVYNATSGGSLYYSYYNGTESWYEWSKSTLVKNDNAGNLASIIIDYGGVVQRIPDSAFSSHSYLISIDLPLCNYIGDDAFRSCYKLQSITLPLCEHLGSLAFESCLALQSIDLPVCSSIGLYTFDTCKSLQSVNLPNCTFISYGAFKKCSALQYINLPLCEDIANEAFRECSALQSIDLPKCSKVGGFAFHYCTSLQYINLPNCTSVHEFVFEECSALQSIDLPLCTYVSHGAFNLCSNLRIVHLPKVMHFRGSAFINTSIETLYMDQITSVPSGVDPFGSAISNLKSIIIPCFLVDDFLSHSIWSKYSSYYVCTDDDTKKIITATDGGGTITLDPEGGRYYSGTTVNIGYSANPGYVFSYFQYGSTRAYGSTVLNESFSLVMNQNWYVSVAFKSESEDCRLSLRYYDWTTREYSNALVSWEKETISRSDSYFNDPRLISIFDYCGVVKSVPKEAFYNFAKDLKSMVLKGCEYIDDYAFKFKVGFGDGLIFLDLPICSYIGNFAFEANGLYEYVNIPNVEYIGYAAFAAPLSYSSDNGGFDDKVAFFASDTLYLPKCSYIGEYAFYFKPPKKSIDLPLVKSLPKYCFYRPFFMANYSIYSGLQVNLPECEYIDESAIKFGGESVTLPKVSVIKGSPCGFSTTSLRHLYLGYQGVVSFSSSLVNGNWSSFRIHVPSAYYNDYMARYGSVSTILWAKTSSGSTYSAYFNFSRLLTSK